MSEKPIGVIAHPKKQGAAELVTALCREFQERGVQFLLEEKTAPLVGRSSTLSIGDLGRDCRMLMVLGGDGTILSTVHRLGKNLVPILGINLGNLGFLTCLSAADFREAVDRAISGDYIISCRVLLAIEIRPGAVTNRYLKPVEKRELPAPVPNPKDGTNEKFETAPVKVDGIALGLNDAVISRGALSRIIELETWVDGVLLTDYYGDGLIVSTPTGSTAYSLSAGGPLLTPESNAFAITPICPHALTNRSVIVGQSSCIDVWVCQPRDEVFLTIDGQQQTALNAGDCVRIRRAEHCLPLVTLQDSPFFEVARKKLNWSGGSS